MSEYHHHFFFVIAGPRQEQLRCILILLMLENLYCNVALLYYTNHTNEHKFILDSLQLKESYRK